MASKEDILEQLVEEYFIHLGYFVRHNVKFKPRRSHPDFVKNQDSNHSDIDVLALNPRLSGPEKVMAVSCKSWQSGFNPKQKIDQIKGNKIVSGRDAWRGFRELVSPKWSEAFISSVTEATAHNQFTYVTAVTAVKGQREVWEQHQPFLSALGGNPIRLLSLKMMLHEVSGALTTTMAGTELGRTLQLFRAAGIAL